MPPFRRTPCTAGTPGMVSRGSVRIWMVQLRPLGSVMRGFPPTGRRSGSGRCAWGRDIAHLVHGETGRVPAGVEHGEGFRSAAGQVPAAPGMDGGPADANQRRQQRQPPLLPVQPSRVHSPAVARSTPVNFADFPPQAFRRPVQRRPWAAVPRREGASRCGGVDVHRRTHGVGVEGDDAAGGVIGQEALGRVHVVEAVDGPICPPTR